MFVYSQVITIIIYILLSFLILLDILVFIFLTPPLQIITQVAIILFFTFFCWIPLWGCPCKTKTCRRITTCLHIIVCDYTAIVCVCVCFAHLSHRSWYQVYYEFQYIRLAQKKPSLHVTVLWRVTCKFTRDFSWMCSSRTLLSSKLLRQKFPHGDLY